jgi:hypothetical protein
MHFVLNSLAYRPTALADMRRFPAHVARRMAAAASGIAVEPEGPKASRFSRMQSAVAGLLGRS